MDADMTSVMFHYCQGKQWTNNEVFNHLQGLIREALKKSYTIEMTGPTIDAQIMAEIWPQIVGFLQPEDMPLKVEVSEPSEWKIGPGPMMVLPPDPLERIADAAEKIATFMDHLPFCGHGNIEVFCGPCSRKG